MEWRRGSPMKVADRTSIQAKAEAKVFDRRLTEVEAAEALEPFDIIARCASAWPFRAA